MRLKAVIAVPKVDQPYLFKFKLSELNGRLNNLHAVLHNLDDARDYIKRKQYNWEKVSHLFESFKQALE